MNTFVRAVVTGLCVTVLVPLTGCITYHGEYSILSNRALDLEEFDPRDAIAKGVYSEGEAVRRIVAYVADRDTYPHLREAIDRALEDGRGDAILNAQVLSWDWYIPLIYGSAGWKVVGDVVNTGSGGAEVEWQNTPHNTPHNAPQSTRQNTSRSAEEILGITPF